MPGTTGTWQVVRSGGPRSNRNRTAVGTAGGVAQRGALLRAAFRCACADARGAAPAFQTSAGLSVQPGKAASPQPASASPPRSLGVVCRVHIAPPRARPAVCRDRLALVLCVWPSVRLACVRSGKSVQVRASVMAWWSRLRLMPLASRG